MNSELRPVAGFEGLYSVTADGRVWSEPRVINKHRVGGRWLTPRGNRCGYVRVGLSQDGRVHWRSVHRMVASAWVDGDTSLQVNHKNGDKADNRAENLEWVTASENVRHSFRELGRVAQPRDHRGEKHPKARLTEEDVLSIYRRAHTGNESARAIGEAFGISAASVYSIKNGRTWKHVTASLLADLEAGD